MSEETGKTENEEAVEAEEAPEQAAPEDTETAAEDDAGPEDKGEGDDSRIAELEAQVADLDDKWKRAMAETVNVQQRAERAKQDATKYGAANFAKAMLNVADNLRRALDAISDEARAEDENLENLWTGVEMTEREMLNAFERLGVKTVEAEGHKLNPHLHDAMMEMEDPSVVAGTIVQVVQSGYQLHDRLLRPAKVIVAKGGPKEAPAAEGEAPAEKGQDKAAAYEKTDGGKGAQLDEEL